MRASISLHRVLKIAMTSKPIADMRITYDLAKLGDRDVLPDPIDQFRVWFEEVLETSVIEANALVLATVTPEGVPQARTLLMKGFDANGIELYTNYHGAKFRQIAANPNVCALFYWPSLQRQVRWTGVAEKLSAAESDEYFASRPRGSQIGAWASQQSTTITSGNELQSRFSQFEKEFEGRDVPRPEHWGGFRIRPTMIEFWQGRENRLHDRIVYTLQTDGSWAISRLAP